MSSRACIGLVLYDDARDSVEYRFGDRIAELTQDADGVDVAFAGGGRRRFDLVVGADGLHSALRAMVFGPRERYVRHLGLALAYYSVPNEFGLDRWLLDYREGGRSAGLRPTRTPPGRLRCSASPRRSSTPITATCRLRRICCGSGWRGSAG